MMKAFVLQMNSYIHQECSLEYSSHREIIIVIRVSS